jgi:hypothetical protein
MSKELAAVVERKVPAVVAVTEDDEMLVLLAPDAVSRCRGSVPDLVSRLTMHASMKSLISPVPAAPKLADIRNGLSAE